MASNMRAGQRFDIRGYYLTARAMHNEEDREYILMHNESSHYLLAVRESEPDGESSTEGVATFIESWDYSQSTDKECAALYCEALVRMTELASEVTHVYRGLTFRVNGPLSGFNRDRLILATAEGVALLHSIRPMPDEHFHVVNNLGAAISAAQSAFPKQG